MTKYLGFFVAAVVLTIGLTMQAQAEPAPSPAVQHQIATLTRRLDWAQTHIEKLNYRRMYLKHFIQQLRHPQAEAAQRSTGVLTAVQVANYARGAGFPDYTIPTMVFYAGRESGFDPRAVNSSSGACGLWQLYPCPGPQALDPAVNAHYAYLKWRASGFAPWS